MGQSLPSFIFLFAALKGAARTLVLAVLAGLLARSLANKTTAGVADGSETAGGLVATVGLGEGALALAGSGFLC